MKPTTNWTCEKCGEARSSKPCLGCEVKRLNKLLDEIEALRSRWVHCRDMGMEVHYPLASILAKRNGSEGK